MNIITIVGLVAAVFSSLSFAPQAIKTLKSKQTKDLSLGMYCITVTGLMLWLTYGILLNDLALILANIITGSLAASILIMKIKYG